MQTPPPPPPPWQPPHHADPMSILGDMVGVPDVATPGISGAQRIWQGSLYLRGHRSDMHLPVVAVRLHTTERPPIQSVTGWPSVLQCDSSRLKPYHSVFPFMLDSATQWFVAFSVIDETGMEVVDDRFVQLVRVLVEQQLAFEIECETHGTLYLWGVNNIQHGTSLLAVFRPSLTTAPTQQTTLDNMRAQICDPPRTSIPASIPTAAGSSAMGYLHSPPPPPVTPAEFAEGQCIWRGDLHVRGHRNNMIVPCVARRYTTPGKLPIYDATGWPTSILCDSSKMIQCVNVFQYVNEPTSLWYARFLPLDENGNEVPNHQKLHALVKVVVERQLAFEIECNEGTFGHGTLYLWGMPVQGLGARLLPLSTPDLTANVMQFIRASQFIALGYAKFGHRGYQARSKHFTPGALDVDLTGRHIVVTGATSGLGRATAEALGSRGATVHLVVRSPERAEPVAAAIIESGGKAQVHECDISSLNSVSSFARKWGTARLDALVNNAGVMMHELKSSADGYEINFATNTLGTYALTEMLLPALEATGGARVVNVSSGGMYTAPLVLDDLEGAALKKNNEIDGTTQYARNKRQQVALTEHWASAHPGVFWAAMHPGWADTPGVAKSMKDFHSALKGQFRTVEQGVDTIVWLAIADEVKQHESGRFFFDREPVQKHLFAARTSYPKERVGQLASKLRDLVTAKGFELPKNAL